MPRTVHGEPRETLAESRLGALMTFFLSREPVACQGNRERWEGRPADLLRTFRLLAGGMKEFIFRPLTGEKSPINNNLGPPTGVIPTQDSALKRGNSL